MSGEESLREVLEKIRRGEGEKLKETPKHKRWNTAFSNQSLQDLVTDDEKRKLSESLRKGLTAKNEDDASKAWFSASTFQHALYEIQERLDEQSISIQNRRIAHLSHSQNEKNELKRKRVINIGKRLVKTNAPHERTSVVARSMGDDAPSLKTIREWLRDADLLS